MRARRSGTDCEPLNVVACLANNTGHRVRGCRSIGAQEAVLTADKSQADSPRRWLPSKTDWGLDGDSLAPIWFRLAQVGAVAVVLAGVAMMLYTRSELWLDEALSVNIANVPLSDLPQALKLDGAPPLYYVALHFWTAIFGDGNLAVRSLSAVFMMLAALPLWAIGRRQGGRFVAAATVLVFVVNPFAVRYATEARQYSLLVLLSGLGYLVLVRALDKPTVGRLACVSVLTAALMYTHYWAISLLMFTGLVLVIMAIRARGGAPLRVIVAMAVGGLAFIPWLPTFLDQMAHTGTPWGEPSPILPAFLVTLTDYSGGLSGGARATDRLLTMAMMLLIVLGLFGTAIDSRRIELTLGRPRRGTGVLAMLLGGLGLALLVASLGGSAYQTRYSSIVFFAFPVLVATGFMAIGSAKGRMVVLGLFLAVSGLSAARNVTFQRTEAGVVAQRIADSAEPGDLVVYCPDQLSVSVDRLLNTDLEEVTYPPTDLMPERIDWVDYEIRNDALAARRELDPERFATDMSDQAGEHRIFLVWHGGYRTYGQYCERIRDQLALIRPQPDTLVTTNPTYFERHDVTLFGPVAQPVASVDSQATAGT